MLFIGAGVAALLVFFIAFMAFIGNEGPAFAGILNGYDRKKLEPKLQHVLIHNTFETFGLAIFACI